MTNNEYTKNLNEELTHSLRIAVNELVTIKRILAEHLGHPNSTHNQGLDIALDRLQAQLDKAGVEL